MSSFIVWGLSSLVSLSVLLLIWLISAIAKKVTEIENNYNRSMKQIAAWSRSTEDWKNEIKAWRKELEDLRRSRDE